MSKLTTFVVFEQFGFLDIVGPGDVFSIANQQAGKKLYQVQFATAGKKKTYSPNPGCA